MATTVVKQGSIPRQRPIGWALSGLAALALAAVTVAAVSVLSQGPASSPADARPATRVYTADERAAIRLVADGVLPESILDAEPFRTKQLVAQGLVPAETLIPKAVGPAPLYCPEERAVMAAVAAGVVPAEALEGEPYRTKRLVAQGLIPRDSVDPCW